ncbi:DUF1642 domain-containing protein [Aerococcus urinaeequi]|uniref:DUF1642 domain-containing protein n=1 Tax=Aerococcus urinaeequi TaxID=51665 RepID=UPI003D6BBF07
MKIEIVKPVIPQFVADWIEQEKKCTTFHKSFSRAINLVKHDENWREWEYEVGNRWSKIVATAWIHGYEIEQEPLYYAKIKGWEHVGTPSYYFGYDEDNDSLEVTYLESNYRFAFSLTKKHWNKLGVNDTNADFERVE